jgi:hypothetical protein
LGLKVCDIEGCNEKHRAKGFCGKHYKQWRKGRLGETVPRDGNQGCRVVSCEGRHEAMGFCSKHYKRWRRGTLSIDGQDIRKRSRCRVMDCQESGYRGGYCEQHFNRLLLMKDLWLNKIMPLHSGRSEAEAGFGQYQAKVVHLEDVRADLDFDYASERDIYR